MTESFSGSVAEIVPVTTPVVSLGVPTVALPEGAVLEGGLMRMLTGTAVVPPCPSLTVTVNESVAAAPWAAAPARADGVGV